MPDYNKPIPFPDPFTSKPFWDGAKQHALMLPRCTVCSRVHFYPRTICPNCGRREIEWIEASGYGRLYAFAVQHRAFGGWADEAPFVTAYIDLDEGDRIFTVLLGVDPNRPEDLMRRIGDRCQVEWVEASEMVNMPYWRLVEEGVGAK